MELSYSCGLTARSNKTRESLWGLRNPKTVHDIALNSQLLNKTLLGDKLVWNWTFVLTWIAILQQQTILLRHLWAILGGDLAWLIGGTTVLTCTWTPQAERGDLKVLIPKLVCNSPSRKNKHTLFKTWKCWFACWCETHKPFSVWNTQTLFLPSPYFRMSSVIDANNVKVWIRSLPANDVLVTPLPANVDAHLTYKQKKSSLANEQLKTSKKWVPPFGQTQNEINHWISFSPFGSDLGKTLGFSGMNLCRVRISVRVGRGGSGQNSDLRGQNPTLPPCLISRNCREISHFWVPTRNMFKLWAP